MFLSSGKIIHISSIFNLHLSPLTHSPQDLWCLDMEKHVCSEELLSTWKPRCNSVVEDYNRLVLTEQGRRMFKQFGCSVVWGSEALSLWQNTLAMQEKYLIPPDGIRNFGLKRLSATCSFRVPEVQQCQPRSTGTPSGRTEAATFQEEIENIHNESRARPVVQAAWPTELTTSCITHWQNPTYLIAKFALSIAGGLLIGFTFYMTSDSLHGIQNKLFVIFLASVLCVPLSQQLQAMFINIRTVYEIREPPSRMYNWTTLIVSQFLVELPWNIMCSSLFFFCWYWTVGFPNDRTGYTTSYMAVASMAPTAVIMSLLFSALFSFVVWMYHVPPFTYFMRVCLVKVHVSMKIAQTCKAHN
ncbi:ABC-2 type transporter-domain-containing protein [Suillus fuscotomentosus]|uniref:ABC-2 type transporter-domain-containing protein n=1 Tax=Suillus fuscotomentosus TaxID=1912939 RepID=A0AAD4DZB2_9AGAM|nr:ABC-2 type transporter-domain-containing protein [Suillus fuscotomentosus]KAG1896722.1 ABC-2 type transporter-domain-containing protein [Suillus fuscotomentosus]